MALERDPAVMRYLNGGLTDVDEAGDPDAPYLMPRGTEAHVWTARRRTNGGFVGWLCLWPDGGQVAELGYRLRRADWGQGLACESATALVGWGFETGRCDAIFASTMAVNTASRRVMEKIGMTHSRTDFAQADPAIAGSEQGEVVYTLTRAQWAARAD